MIADEGMVTARFVERGTGEEGGRRKDRVEVEGRERRVHGP